MNADVFLELMETIESSGGVHLTEPCMGRKYKLAGHILAYHAKPNLVPAPIPRNQPLQVWPGTDQGTPIANHDLNQRPVN